MHVTLIVGSTISAFLIERPNKNSEESAYFILTAVQEMFLAYNMFFILDERKRPEIKRTETRHNTYDLVRVV